MSTRHVYLMIFALLCASHVGCCGYMQGCGMGMGGQVYDSCCASCGCPEASCCCPEASCCCPEASCCCPEPSCCVEDPCCEASCGCDDVCCGVGCGSGIAPCPILGRCWILQRLCRAFRGNYGCYGCSSEGYWSEWHNDPPCNCQAGGRYGGPYGRRAQLAKQHQDLSQDLRFANEGSGPTFR